MKKFKITLILGLLVFLMSSCKFTSFDTNTLLTPPLMSSENQQINKAITEVAGGAYEPVYPKNGNYKSSVISVKLTEDKDSMICFYTSGAQKNVSFIILEQNDGKWSRTGIFKSKAIGVERIDFCDIDKDGKKEIVIGWQYLSGEENAMEILSVANENEIVSKFTGMYNAFFTFEESVVVISKNTALKTSSATYIGNTQKGIGIINTVSLNNSIAGFIKIQTGITTDIDNNKTNVIFIDEQLESKTYVTELLTFGNSPGDTLNVANLNTQILRQNANTCIDVNEDSLPDIPIEKTLPMYYRNGTEESMSYIDWYSYKNGTLEYIKSAYTSVNEPYYIEFPAEWIGKINIKRDAVSERTIHFYRLEKDGETPMFSIRIFSQQAYEENNPDGRWQEITTANENVYTYNAFESELPDAFKTDVETLKKYLKITA